MCHFSTTAKRSRPATEGEELVITASGGMKMLTAPGDSECAVCVRDGTVLTMSGLPMKFREAFGVGPEVNVTVFESEGDGNFHFDEVELETGERVPFQALPVGVTAVVTAHEAIERATAAMLVAGAAVAHRASHVAA